MKSGIVFYPHQRDRDEYLEAVINPNLTINGNIGDAFRFFVEKLSKLSSRLHHGSCKKSLIS